jgi:hypothetical protein
MLHDECVEADGFRYSHFSWRCTSAKFLVNDLFWPHIDERGSERRAVNIPSVPKRQPRRRGSGTKTGPGLATTTRNAVQEAWILRVGGPNGAKSGRRRLVVWKAAKLTGPRIMVRESKWALMLTRKSDPCLMPHQMHGSCWQDTRISCCRTNDLTYWSPTCSGKLLYLLRYSGAWS